MDDVESWFYTCVYWLFGTLPWDKNKEERYVYKEKKKLQHWPELARICVVLSQIWDIIIKADRCKTPDYGQVSFFTI